MIDADTEAELARFPDPEPLPVGLPPVAPFDPELLPLALRSYVMDIAERMQCPPDFAAVGFIVVLSSLVGSRLGIRPKRHDDWLVIPNLWGAIVGRPSEMKTPTLAETIKPLYRLEHLARSIHEERVLVHEAQIEAYNATRKENKRKAAEKLKKGAEQSEIVELLRREASPRQPIMRRYVVNDATVEKLGEILQENPEGVLLFRDELTGWLRSMDRDGHEGDRAFYLEAWTGAKPFTYDRIGRGSVFIESCTVSVLGGIQPGPLRDYVSHALKGGAGDDGLLQRFQLIVWPDGGKGKEWRNVDRYPDSDYKSAVWRIFESLSKLSVPHEEGEVPFTRFGLEAQETFEGWRERLEYRLRNESMPDVIEAHLAKYRSLVPSLALVFHLADGNEPISRVEGEHVIRAIAWANYLETHARRVYSQALEPGMAAAIALAEKLDDLPDPFTARDVYKNHWAKLDREAVEKALVVLEDFGHVVKRESEQVNGRPTIRYDKNPKLKNFSENLGRGGIKSAKSTDSGGIDTFDTGMTQESEKNFSDDTDRFTGPI